MRTHLLAPLACAVLLAACGGGGSDNSGSTPTEPIKAAVVETAVATPAISGQRVVACGNGVTCTNAITEDGGKFDQVVGGTLDFYVGPLKILSAADTSKAITSILSFSTTGDENDATFINQMSLLYSLDEDADPTNGISISAEAHTVMQSQPWSAIKFDVAPDVFVSNTALQSLVNAVNAVATKPGVSLTVRDPAQVKETVKQLLFKERWGGTWTLTLDDDAATTVALTVAADGTVKIGDTGATFSLQTLSSTQADMRFTQSSVGSFIGKINADGTGKGTWSKVGTTPTAGWWTAKRSTETTSK